MTAQFAPASCFIFLETLFSLSAVSAVAHRSLQEQHKWPDLEILKSQGDDRLGRFYRRWRLMTTAWKLTFRKTGARYSEKKIRQSKQLQPDIVEFDRPCGSDPRGSLKWLNDCIDRLLSRARMEWSRFVQRKLLKSGAIDVDATLGQSGSPQGPQIGQ